MRKGILWRWYHVDVFWYSLCGVSIEKIDINKNIIQFL